MMRRRVMFGKIIGVIVEAFAPMDQEFAILDAVFDPIEAHVDGLRSVLFDFVIGNACCDGIASLKWG
jgi:hypothetical protein